MLRVFLLLLMAAGTGLGCQARQVAQNGVNFRQSLITMYTDQAMDNLVRAKTNQPFVQIAYRNLTVQDTDSLAGTGAIGSSSSGSPSTASTGALLSVLNSFSNTFSLGGAAARTQTMSFQADPITDQNDIYLLYRAFASDPNLLVESEEKPQCPVHIMVKSNNKYYWVPCDAAPLFFELVMRTTFMRGPDLQPPVFYSVKIARVLAIKDQPNSVIIELSGLIPNGDADMRIPFNGKRLQLSLNRIVGREPETDDGEIIHKATGDGYDSPTRYFRILKKDLTEKKIPLAELTGLPVQVYSREYPPTPPKTSPELKRLLDNQDLIRVNLNNLTPNH